MQYKTLLFNTIYFCKNTIFKSPEDSGTCTTRANISQFTFVPAITQYTNPKQPTFGAGSLHSTQRAANANFVLNAVDQLALDPDLIKIRSRDIASRPIPEEVKSKKLTYVLFNMLTAPIILLIVGVMFGLRRRKRDAAA